ncbi:with coiled-coil, ANK repeat and PH domain-containing protein [Seminavis robusta]|uniref:With coiled-coil, ANK repeat and PH domain-containing protein n=1 Tax=Seminavis robusta TaxID=568900 RepID=A0A9N8DDJ7_9STRA|nr:with coiled-coil, ANK repeat and PH domain-containing protein [Seminavis robusta]|eukprot:Sro24_g016480.1 with coiled-coil, ANK repeat and PH domain-containing protein (390) ;mRNA; r:105584-106849
MTDGSNFSDNALTTLESLVLECQLENARQDDEKRRGSIGSACSTVRLKGSGSSKKKYNEMPAEDRAFIQTLPGNNKCADCGSSDTEWASITYGILICTKCSGVHRAMGTHLSRVRSVKMDSWADNHIKAMRHGGNKKCRDYLRKRGLKLKECTIKERYESPVAKKYHQKLKAAVKVVTEEHPLHAKPTKRASTTDIGIPTPTTQGSAENNGDNNDVPVHPVSTTILNTPPPSSRPPISPAAMLRFRRFSTTASATRNRPTRSLSASAPTIFYMGRSFQANNPSAANNDDTLRIDDWDVQRKLEHWWYHRGHDDEENDEHYSYSNASSSLSSNSLSRSSSYFGGGSTATSRSGPALTWEDLRALQTDPEIKDYVRQQLLQRWDEKGNPRK